MFEKREEEAKYTGEGNPKSKIQNPNKIRRAKSEMRPLKNFLASSIGGEKHGRDARATGLFKDLKWFMRKRVLWGVDAGAVSWRQRVWRSCMSIDEAIAALRERNEEVPKPMRLPAAAEVDAAEKELGVTFHPDYRRYLLEA